MTYKSYWKLSDKENGEIISVFEKEIASNKDLDYITQMKERWDFVQITEGEYQYLHPVHGVAPVPKC